ncbi:hypothetical protein CHLNCDRAFT_144451 [Chlorella variabilis]|uniref:CAP-Gly domain-containing protein n=1 Tax=Chlorella variabilis TaxID=554065 RepID=E1ZBH0_CHLVA|nr:hypothetical protein CHLNCDRAFT_144451 [Chlorella variabilis]EFN56852.1 hypothetical protein CHLNCDRAFT_144451 [Chlorella variabilis]|eukprot:XP_005848954.1 hypothetical protein CHLNCDRAFT_144451 [Chlorella variabilis]
MAVQEPVAGARVLLGGKHRATVRYVGPIEGQQGTWVGIEYDEAGKGKHDGSHGGRRYFCAHDPTAGSFVRLPKFLEAADFGRSLVAAALERYGLSSALERAAGGGGGGQPASGVDPAQQQEEQQQMYVSTASNRRVTVELLAPEASARRLSGAGAALAALVQHRISSLGSGSELRAMLPGLTELDLSDNLFSSWTFVAELATALPSLAALNLSGNRLALPSPTLAPAAPPPAAPASLAGLQTLVLNGCGVAWPQAVAVAQLLPTLRELHLCANGLASLHLPAAVGRSGCDVASAAEAAAGISLLLLGAPAAAAPGSGSSSSSRSSQGAAALLAAAFGRLEVLDLENNALSSWADVALLSTLPCLRSLLLSGNRLEEVRYEGGFTALRALLLGGNRLGSWEAASQLDRFPALEEARLSDNPLTAAAPSTVRYQCIARISRLSTLNASAVSAAERWDAEVNYLRQVSDELAGAADVAGGSIGGVEAARAAVLAAHPRFPALVQKYGELAPAAPRAAAGSALASSMAQLTICHGTKRVEKKLPVTLTIGKLKLMLERLLRVKAAQQALLLVPPEGSASQPEDVSDEEGRELRYFDVADSWRLEVRVADPAARAAALAAAKAAATAAHAARMEQHEKAIQQFRAVEQRLMA